jgi:hypothetical protein
MCNLLILDPVWVSAIAAAIAAIATAVYAFFTWKLIIEMKEDRKLSYKPIIKANLTGGLYPGRLEFELKNVGKGPAIDLKFDCRDNGEIQWKIQKEIFKIGNGERAELIFEFGKESYRPGDKIFLDIKYNDILGNIYKDQLLTLNTEEVMEELD